VIVHQHDGRRRQFERTFHHFPDIDRGVIDRARLLHLVGNDLVALVEKDDADLGQVFEFASARPNPI